MKTMVSMQGIGYRQVFEYLEGNLSWRIRSNRSRKTPDILQSVS